MTDEQVKDVLAENLRQLLEEHGWSGSHLAEICGESQPTISNILNGKHVPKIGAVTRIAAAFKVSVDYLLSTHPEKSAQEELAMTA